MHHHFQTQSERFQIPWETWTPRSSPATPKSNVFVTVELVQLPAFKDYVAKLHAHRRLARIIVDEVHLVLTHRSFREVMQQLTWIGPTGPQIILQTATLPPVLQKPLLTSVGLTTCQVVRSKTCRPNISMGVIHCRADALNDVVKSAYQIALNQTKEGRVMVFCRSKAKVEEIAGLLGIQACHSGIPQAVISFALDHLYDGTHRGVVATGLLGVAVDVPQVTHVIHVDYPYDIVSYVQEAGRAGREGERSKAWSIVIIPQGVPRPKEKDEDDLFGREAIRRILQANDTCRRLAIHCFLDGVAEPCSMIPGTVHFCDVCSTEESHLPTREANSGFPWTKIHSLLGNQLPTLPEYHSSTPPPPTSIHLQTAAAHATRHQPPPLVPMGQHQTLGKLYHLMNRLTFACVACWLQGENEYEHLLEDCLRADSPTPINGEWISWKAKVDIERGAREGVCYACACPQDVSFKS